MKFLKDKKKLINYFFIFVLFLLVVWAGKGLFKYSVYSTHDGNHHLSRSFDAIATIKEGHFPLRWAGSLNYFCGVPIYNFFYPLFYYLVIGLFFIFKDVYLSLKLVSFFSLLAGTIFFYLWAKSETKSNWAGLGGAVLYLFAPYRFLLIFVRESPEFLAYALLPVVLYFFSLCFKKNKFAKFFTFAFLAAFFGGFLTISHNFTVMFLMPIILIYLVIKTTIHRPQLKRVLVIFLSFLSSFGLGSFFIFPALLEKKFTKIGLEAFLDFRQHFPTLGQLIRSSWGYFYSAPGVADDGMSFQLGYAHWFVLAVSFLFLFYLIIKKGKTVFCEKNIWFGGFLLLAVGTIFLILPWSLFVWEVVPIIQQIQFSWRLLGIAVFAISSLFVYLVSNLKGSIKYLLVIFVSFLAVFGNRNHLLPQPVSEEDIGFFADYEENHPHRYSTTTLGDDVIYPTASQSCTFDTPLLETVEGEKINYSVVYRKNTSGLVNFFTEKKVPEDVRLGLGYFPGAYQFSATNGMEIDYRDCGGQVCISKNYFSSGENYISWQIVQTPTEKMFNLISLLFLVFWLADLFWISILKKPVPKKKIVSIFLGFLAVFLLFSYFRFNSLSKRVIFNWDQERDANIVSQMFFSKKPVLIGPRVLGPEGFFLPPTFYYLLLPFYLLFGFSPYSIVGFIVFYNLLFFFLAGLLVKKMFGLRTSLVFLSFWSVSSYLVSADIISWNPLLIPLFVLVALYMFFKAKKTSSRTSDFFFGLIFGLGISFHIQFLGLLPILLLYIFNKKEKIKSLAFVVIGLALPFSSLFLFDLRHQFLNTNLLLNLFSEGETGTATAFLPVWQNVVSGLLGKAVNLPVSIVFYFGFLSLLVIFLKKNKNKFFWQGLLLVWLAFPFAFSFYGQRPSEYYFNYLLPIIVLVLSLILSFLFKNKKTSLLLIAGFLLLLAGFGKKTFSDINFGKDNLYYKSRLVEFLANQTEKKSPVNLSYDRGMGGDAGFGYLVDYWQVNLSKDEDGPLVEVVLSEDERANFKFGASGLLFPTGWLEDNWL